MPSASEKRNPGQWRGLEEWADSAVFADLIAREFPDDTADWADPVTRRHFLALLGASLGLAGLSGCSPRPAPAEKILPYVRQPEAVTLGVPLFFATASTLGGVALGLLAKSHEGRPVKVEGNPDHPGSRGATDLFSQASVLGLYDPDRSQGVTLNGAARGWDEALAALRAASAKLPRGAGLRLLSETITSPTLAGQFDELLHRFPEAKWVQYDPAGRFGVYEGSRLAFGEPVHTVYDFTHADVILALDADFLSCGPGNVRYAGDFADKRRVRAQSGDGVRPENMSRLYAVECMLTNTGAAADHRLPLRPGEIVAFARALAAEIGVANAPAVGDLSAPARRWLTPLVADLRRAGKNALVIAGDTQPAAVHAAAHAVNQALGAIGTTVQYTDSLETRPADQLAELQTLVEEMRDGHVDVLMVFGSNPVYSAPADLDFAAALDRVPFRFHLGLHQDETAVLCHWHVPAAHELESWGDARGYDGTVTLLQPLIAPLYGGRTISELLAAVLEQPERLGRDIVRAFWRQRPERGSTDFESFWQQSLQMGLVPGTALPRRNATLRDDWAGRAFPPVVPTTPTIAPGGMEIAFRPDPTVWDGRFANNAWLQELPKPITRLTWDNAAFVSPATAARLGLSTDVSFTGGEHGQAVVDLIELSINGRMVRAPAWVVPGHADDAVTVTLGYGRERAGRVGDGHGFNAYQLRTADAPWSAAGLSVTRTTEKYHLACVQMHHSMADRKPVRHGTSEEFQRDPDFAKEPVIAEHLRQGPADRRLHPLTLYPEQPHADHRWAMAIDLSACVGCGACVVACQAENNIPVVGKTEVMRGREMHWLRIDRYYEGDPAVPAGLENFFQPVPCMHCENAPCELVCPVGATVHSADGLNDMIYNRCVGTRYCSNNCPYKVRRFNFLQYADYATESLKVLHNPDVTVRSRGVMEKCTYCVQRIRIAESVAERERRPIADGDIRTACQAACPTRAIVFGDLNDSNSAVNHWKAEPHNYGLLADLNTRPRTTYLAAMRNPNPAMPKEA